MNTQIAWDLDCTFRSNTPWKPNAHHVQPLRVAGRAPSESPGCPHPASMSATGQLYRETGQHRRYAIGSRSVAFRDTARTDESRFRIRLLDTSGQALDA